MNALRDRSREKQLRHLASRFELQLVRSWAPWRVDHGTYALIDSIRNTLVLADPASGFGMSLDDVQAYLQTFAPVKAEKCLD